MNTTAMLARQTDYYVTHFKRTWRGSVVSAFVQPMLFLAAMGLALGSYIDDSGTSELGGLTYLDYVAPGMLAVNAMQTAVGESSWPVLGNFKWTKVYFSMISTPLRISEVMTGHMLANLARVGIASVATTLILAAFGTVSSLLGGVVAVLVVMLVGAAFIAPVFAYAGSLENDSGLALLFRLGIVPLMLFSGAFFPVSQLPDVVEWLSYASPIWHGVELARMATTGVVAWAPAVGHVAYLLAWVVGGWLLANHVFHRRLQEG